MSERFAFTREEPVRLARRGLLMCRGGNWAEGLELLGRAFDAGGDHAFPGTVYSFLGYGLAREYQKYRQGLSLCEHALRIQPEEVENHLNMARTLVVMNRRLQALGIINRGLAVAPRNAALRELRLSLGVRRSPVLTFLRRSHPLNRMLGRLRQGLRANGSTDFHRNCG